MRTSSTSNTLPRVRLSLRWSMFAWLSLVGCASSRFWAVEQTHADTLRTVTQGQLLGGPGRYGSHAWLGVPFARSPLGELRWRKPLPPESWQGVRAATTSGPACPQPSSMLSGSSREAVVGSEDCLTLNLWAPPFTTEHVPRGSERLPVMVWIHGGGNSIGTAAFYEGGRLATEQRVIVVAVQYRLGPLGWLRHPALREGADAVDASGNFGTLDLIRSLEWVRDNIASFGGNPDNVTIFGESAGGNDVYTLLLAPAAKGLFHRAIVESGGLWSAPLETAEGFVSDTPASHHNSSDEALARIRVQAKLAPDLAVARTQLKSMTPDALARWMRSLSPEVIIEAYAGGRGGMLNAPLVFRDGTVLPADDWLTRLSMPNGWNQVPVLAGTNRDEMRLFLFLDPKRVKRVLGLFPRLVDEREYVAVGDFMSHFWKLSGVDAPLSAMRNSGTQALYAYRWDWREEPVVAGGDLSVMLGAAHGLEIPFVFGHFDLGRLNLIFDKSKAAENEALSSSMRQYWAQFARTGAPGRGTSGTEPEWQPFSMGPASHLLLDVAQHGGPRMGAEVDTERALLAELFGETALHVEQRCRLLHDLIVRGPMPRREAYDAQEACKPFAFESFNVSAVEVR